MSTLLALLEFHHRANLNGTISSGRNLRGQRNRFVEVFAIHQIKAAELLFRFGKWTIGGQGPPITDTHGRRTVGRHECAPTLQRSTFRRFFSIYIVSLELSRQLFLVPLRTGGLVLVDQQYVMHDVFPSSGESLGMAY